MEFVLHVIAPEVATVSRGNLSDHSPLPIRIFAFFLPKNTLERNENKIGC